MITTKQYMDMIRPGIFAYINRILENPIHQEHIVTLIKDDQYVALIIYVADKLGDEARKNV